MLEKEEKEKRICLNNVTNPIATFNCEEKVNER